MRQEGALKITILTDRDSWMNRYDRELEGRLSGDGHEVTLVQDRDDLQDGDIAFFLSCFEIVGREYLARNRHNIVVHASDLPRGKGWSPTTWQILEGKDEIPLSLFEATEAVDAGCVYIRDAMRLDGGELVDEWQEKLGRKIVDMCCEFVAQCRQGRLAPVEQNGEESFYPRRRPEDSRLDVHKTIAEQFNLLRVVDNAKYPAFFEINGQRYYIRISRA